uniref:Uncharacterized protein n=1 Tax=Anguilla anguilla TaxID=7936 RepID=A0A0E9PYJ7_ANGAN
MWFLLSTVDVVHCLVTW